MTGCAILGFILRARLRKCLKSTPSVPGCSFIMSNEAARHHWPDAALRIKRSKWFNKAVFFNTETRADSDLG
ncbi:hypothetical protein E2C01_077532 [Portunus trituberculatus]|uniref:Uncharacterized protein n=1 Tax=Portunus trituberculatus TaxID=210409 RepID=A0A5B7IMJ8_PORTR|nr:hypothetical protein [Portunus trituberculatus]